VYGVGKLKIAFLEEVPYVLARLGEPGVKELAIEQWNSAPPEKHHPVSIMFFGENSILASHIFV
jgi:hypothetical protein